MNDFANVVIDLCLQFYTDAYKITSYANDCDIAWARKVRLLM